MDLAECAPRLLPLLGEEERARFERYRFDKDKLLHLAAHALLRDVLSRHTGELPESWRFEKNKYGKPRVVAPESGIPLEFNLSHTRGMVVCGVSKAGPVGVDVEEPDRRVDCLGICDRFFSPFEADRLRALPESEQRTRFFSYWTLKESYIKARGMGISLPLEKFSFLLEREGRVDIEIDPELNDSAPAWRLGLMRTDSGHHAAFAVRPQEAGRAIRVEVLEVAPFEPAITARFIPLAVSSGVEWTAPKAPAP
jgi:4'-phosphopantetheinyl transferase